jgi:hypothetical protein
MRSDSYFANDYRVAPDTADVGLWQKNNRILKYSAGADFSLDRRVWTGSRIHSHPVDTGGFYH